MTMPLTYCVKCGGRTPVSAMDIFGRCPACQPPKTEAEKPRKEAK